MREQAEGRPHLEGRPQQAGTGANADPSFAAAVRQQLDRVLGHAAFEATDRMRAILVYVVEEALAGRSDHIKAFTIALDALGRDASFDAHSDPLVRIEAGHLRRALERYYHVAGSADPIVIEIPKGAYVPKFTARQPAAGGSWQGGRAPPWRRAVFFVCAAAAAIGLAIFLSMQARISRPEKPDIPRLVVAPFTDPDKKPETAYVTKGLTNEVLVQLAKFKDIVVIDGTHPSKELDEQARYVLGGDVMISGDRMRMLARVVDRSDGTVLWSDRYEEDLSVSKVLEIQLDIARKVGTALGQPYGVIHQADLSKRLRLTPDNWSAYACTLAYYTYRTQLDAKTHPEIRRCLEGAVAQFPTYATAWALLSQVYVDEVRFHYRPDPSAKKSPIERALEAATRARQIEPDNVRALQAEMLALYFAGRHEAALSAGRRAIAQNPNDTELAGEFGFRAAAAGDWALGCSLLARARERNPGPLGYFEIALAICAYFRGEFAEATMWIQKTPMLENHNYHLIAAAIYAEAGLTSLCEKEREWLLARAPKVIANVRNELATRYLRAEDRERLLQSFRKAGLPVPES
jgi:TolB-like protein/tetratricopeptide (TPR) repeat protein